MVRTFASADILLAPSGSELRRRHHAPSRTARPPYEATPLDLPAPSRPQRLSLRQPMISGVGTQRSISGSSCTSAGDSPELVYCASVWRCSAQHVKTRPLPIG